MSDKMIPKVVPIKSFMKPSKAVKLLRECSELASDGLSKSLAAMMGQVDDALFELAEKAENNVVQSLYFDAMREVRLKRGDMEAVFKRSFETACNAVIESEPVPTDTQTELTLDGELMLVEDNHLETSLAVTNMVGKVQHLCKEELFALETRVGLLLGKPELPEDDNPFNPTLICNAFKEACNELEADIKVRLIILKLFEKYVVPDLRQVYQQLNEHLARNNILPRINYAIQRAPGAAPAYGEGAAPLMPGEAGGDPFGAIQALLEQNPQGGIVAATPVAGGAAAGGTMAAPTAHLLSSLTQLQHGNLELLAQAGADTALLDSAETNVLRQLKQHQVLGALPREHDQTIDIVAMLFDYILEDKNIPDRMHAVIGRLQIPILKVVMLDKSFFSKKNHPARKFLDTLSQAAIGLSEEQEAEELYIKAEQLVQQVISDFEDDMTVFEDVLDELESHLEKLEEKASEDLERLQQEAAEQERLERARLKAAEEVRQRLEERDLNDTVREFIDEQWKTLLMMTFLMEGDDSDAWLSSVETMDTLIWSVAPKKTAEERQQLVSALPALLANLRQGMELLEMAAEDCERFFARLARCHSEAVSARHRSGGEAGANSGGERGSTDDEGRMRPEAPDSTPPVPGPGPGEENREASAPDNPSATFDQPPSLTVMKKIAGMRAAEILAQIEQGTLEVEEITLSNTQGGGMVDEIHDEYTVLVQNLENGAWITFKQADGGQSQEKLTWINTTTGIYMFTNRNGKNTRNLTFYQFAEEFRKGRAEVMEETPLVDRAMNSLIDDLSKKS